MFVPESRRERFRAIRLYAGSIQTSTFFEDIVFESRVAANGSQNWMTVVNGQEFKIGHAWDLVNFFPGPCEVIVNREGMIRLGGKWLCIQLSHIYAEYFSDESGEWENHRLRATIDGKTYETQRSATVLGAAFMLDGLLHTGIGARFRSCIRCKWVGYISKRSTGDRDDDLHCYRDEVDNPSVFRSDEHGSRIIGFGVHFVSPLHCCPAWQPQD